MAVEEFIFDEEKNIKKSESYGAMFFLRYISNNTKSKASFEPRFQ